MDKDVEYLLAKISELERRIFNLEKAISTGELSDFVKGRIENKCNECNSRKIHYLFEGKSYKKSRLVLNVVKKFVESNPNISLKDLLKAFPSREFHTPYDCVMNLQELPEKYIKPVKRYFVDDPIILADGTSVVVCTQWGTNTTYFIEYVTQNYGYKIEEVK